MIQRRVGARASHSCQLRWIVGGCVSDLTCCHWTVVTFILAWRKWCGKICMCRAKKWTKVEEENLCLPIAASCSSICHLSHGRLIPHAAYLNLPYSSSPRLLERFSGCLADDREGRTRVSIIWKFLFKLVEYAYQGLEFIDIYHNFHYRLNII